MRSKQFIMVSLLVIMGVIGGCHYGSHDDYRGYEYSNRSGYGSGSYRDGFRDGRAYERRNEVARDSRYSSDSWWRRW